MSGPRRRKHLVPMAPRGGLRLGKVAPCPARARWLVGGRNGRRWSLIVNSRVRDALRSEGAVANEETRLATLAPAGMSVQEKAFARFYSRGQLVVFSRDNPGIGVIRDTEYRVHAKGRDARGREVVSLIAADGRRIDWDPRLGRTSQVNVFREEQRDLSVGDRIQWRLVNRELGIRNAERGTVERLDGTVAMIRWDRDARMQEIDLSRHRTWDHGYAETVYSAQSKTYHRVFVLAPVASRLVTGQNYYTAITRARFGAKLWTEDRDMLVERLARRSGEKTSAIEGLGRLTRDSVRARSARHADRLGRLREEQLRDRSERHRADLEEADRSAPGDPTLPGRLATRALSASQFLDRWLTRMIERSHEGARLDARGSGLSGPAAPYADRTERSGGDGTDRGGERGR